MIMPNRENIQKLVDALRSGEYKQYQSALRSNDGSRHCCLGVACDIYKKVTNTGTWDCNGFGFIDEQHFKLFELPPTVRNWFGFESENPIIMDNEEDVKSTAIGANDNGATFAEIADLFEQYYLKDTPAV